MKKRQFITALAKEAQVTQKTAEAVVRAFVCIVTDAVANGDDVNIAGLGTFTSKIRKARTGRNPISGEKIESAI